MAANEPFAADAARPARLPTASLAAAAAGALVALLLALAPAARADISFGPAGSGAGQLQSPRSLAVDYATGELFVADAANSRISVFDENGDFLRAFGWGVDTGAAQLQVCTTASGCQAGIAGAGSGQFAGGSSAEPRLAVDNDPASPSFHDLFVYDFANRRVQRFTAAGAFVLAFGDGVNDTNGGDLCTAASGHTCGAGTSGFGAGQFNDHVQVALGAGAAHVADCTACGGSTPATAVHRVQTFAPSGTLTGQPVTVSGGGAGRPTGLAVASTGDIYLGVSGLPGVSRYDSAGNALGIVGDTPLPGLALDSADDLYVLDHDLPLVGGMVIRYDSAGDPVSVIYGDSPRHLYAARALAIRPGPGGDLYAIDRSESVSDQIAHLAFEPPGPVVLPGIDDQPNGGFNNAAFPIGNTAATLNTHVNPEGAATTYHFEYVDDASFQASGFANAVSTSELAVGSDFEHQLLTRELTGLTPETTYHARAVATNANGTDAGPTFSFTTREPFELGAAYSTAVDLHEATLHAELNPLGIPASGHFDYVDDAGFQASGFTNASQTPSLDFGDAEDELVTRSVQLSGLDPATTYHYRFVAQNSFTTRTGPTQTFRTFTPPDPPETDCPNQQLRTGTPSSHLPDCRAYEMVSPPDKDGGEIFTLVGLDDHAFGNQRSDLVQATADGAKLTYSSYRAFADPESAAWVSQYLASRDPDAGWQSEWISPRRDSFSNHPAAHFDQPYDGFTPDLCTGFLLEDSDVGLDPADNAGYLDLYRRDNCDDSGSFELLTTASPAAQPPNHPAGFPNLYFPRVQGFSADASKVVIRANENLTPNASSAAHPNGRPIYQLYLHAGGALRLVSVLPSPGGSTQGAASPEESSLGSIKGGDDADHRAGTTMNAVSADGTRVFFSTPLLDAFPPVTSNPSLYLRLNADRAASPVSGGQCTDPARACTLPVSESVSADAAEFLAASPDGGKAIFRFRNGASDRELHSYDVATETPSLIADGVLGVLGTSEDLTTVYLVSTEALDVGATAGQPNLYLWQAGAGHRFIATLSGEGDGTSWTPSPINHSARVTDDAEVAVFVSSAPLTGYDNHDAVSGKRADQVFRYDAAADGGTGELRCLSCNPTGARPRGRRLTHPNVLDENVGRRAAAYLPTFEYSLHETRVLSADGDRLFFEAFDRLLPADTNGLRDVYQWQLEDSGDCDDADAAFVPASGGCLSLISSGQDSKDSRFVDASADGTDAFFVTAEPLHGSDPDGLLDIYDARTDGGFPFEPPPEPCSGDDCQGAPSGTPSDPGSGSSANTGPGNQGRDRTPPVTTCPKGKRLKGGRCVKKNQKKRKGRRS